MFIQLNNRTFKGVTHNVPTSTIICVSSRGTGLAGADVILVSGGLLEVKESVADILTALNVQPVIVGSAI